MEKEPSFLVGIWHNLPHYFSASQGIIEELIGLASFCFGLLSFAFVLCICSCVSSVYKGSFGIRS